MKHFLLPLVVALKTIMPSAIRFTTTLLVAAASSFVLQGCATMEKVSLDKDTLGSISRLKVVRAPTPEIYVNSVLSGLGALFPLPALISIAVDINDAGNINKNSGLPDMGALVTKSFATQARNEIPAWKDIQVEAKPMAMPPKEGHRYEDGHLLAFDEVFVMVWSDRFTVTASVKMFDRHGKTIYNGVSLYNSNDYNKTDSQNDYLADSGKLLIDEMPLAADRLAKDVIKQLRETRT